MQIFHNPRCRKSRETLQIIEEAGAEVEVVEYLKTPPTVAELKNILSKLDMNVKDIIRKGEPIFKENFKGKDLSDEEWLQALVEFPRLIERPIVIKGEKAVLGRPPENVNELL